MSDERGDETGGTCQACGSETETVSGVFACRECGYNGIVAKEYRAKEWRERHVNTDTERSEGNR